MNRCLIPFLFVALVGCSDHCVFHRICGTTNYPATQTNAIRVDISKRARFIKCGAELLGTLDGVDTNIVPYVVSRKGGTHFIMIGHTAEVWHSQNTDVYCIDGHSK